jgi:hypothetical protein
MQKQKVDKTQPLIAQTFTRELPDSEKALILKESAVELRALFDNFSTPLSRRIHKKQYDVLIEELCTKIRRITGKEWDLQSLTIKAKDPKGLGHNELDLIRLRLQCWDAYIIDDSTIATRAAGHFVPSEIIQLTCSILRYELPEPTLTRGKA